VERVQDNSNDFKVPFETELKRVMVHGVLHYCGYKDKGEENEP
jgi:ssRNA-specific RNase YbeY (16S rRNA maturation enzyme)